MWSNELIVDVFEAIKKHKDEIDSKGYVGKEKGMSTLVEIEFEKGKSMEIIFKFSGSKWPQKGKSKKEKLSL